MIEQARGPSRGPRRICTLFHSRLLLEYRFQLVSSEIELFARLCLDNNLRLFQAPRHNGPKMRGSKQFTRTKTGASTLPIGPEIPQKYPHFLCGRGGTPKSFWCQMGLWALVVPNHSGPFCILEERTQLWAPASQHPTEAGEWSRHGQDVVSLHRGASAYPYSQFPT